MPKRFPYWSCGSLMVSIPPANCKLRQRGQRIVSQATGLPEETTQAVLQSCGGEVNTAIVTALAEVSPAEARLRLQPAGGSVRRTLQESPDVNDLRVATISLAHQCQQNWPISGPCPSPISCHACRPPKPGQL